MIRDENAPPVRECQGARSAVCAHVSVVSFPWLQTPLDFVMHGELDAAHEGGPPEQVGLALVPGYVVRVVRVKCLHCLSNQDAMPFG